jgi:ankyrin repeat protein
VAVAAYLLSIRDAAGKSYSACKLDSKDNSGKTPLDTIENREVIEYLKTTAKAEGIALPDQGGTSGNLSKSVREHVPAKVSKKK